MSADDVCALDDADETDDARRSSAAYENAMEVMPTLHDSWLQHLWDIDDWEGR